jgi:hypothetical protein
VNGRALSLQLGPSEYLRMTRRALKKEVIE